MQSDTVAVHGPPQPPVEYKCQAKAATALMTQHWLVQALGAVRTRCLELTTPFVDDSSSGNRQTDVYDDFCASTTLYHFLWCSPYHLMRP